MLIAFSELERLQQESRKLPLCSEWPMPAHGPKPPVITFGDSYTLSHNDPYSVSLRGGNYCLLMLCFIWCFSFWKKCIFFQWRKQFKVLTFLKRKRRSYMLAFSCNHFKHQHTLVICLSKPVRTGRFLFFFLAGGESS